MPGLGSATGGLPGGLRAPHGRELSSPGPPRLFCARPVPLGFPGWVSVGLGVSVGCAAPSEPCPLRFPYAAGIWGRGQGAALGAGCGWVSGQGARCGCPNPSTALPGQQTAGGRSPCELWVPGGCGDPSRVPAGLPAGGVRSSGPWGAAGAEPRLPGCPHLAFLIGETRAISCCTCGVSSGKSHCDCEGSVRR